jgi:hypothetical protein
MAEVIFDMVEDILSFIPTNAPTTTAETNAMINPYSTIV